jgi:hypothetical protein
MKRKFKQWWLTMPPTSTKRTITSHLKSLNTKKTMTYYIGNSDPCLGLFLWQFESSDHASNHNGSHTCKFTFKYVYVCRSLFVLLVPFHCVVFPSSIYRFWLPLWYLQTPLIFLYQSRVKSIWHQALCIQR